MTLVEIYQYVQGLVNYIQSNKKLTIAQIKAINQEVKQFTGIMRLMGSSFPGEVIRVHKGEFKPSQDSYSEIERMIDRMSEHEKQSKTKFRNIRKNGVLQHY